MYVYVTKFEDYPNLVKIGKSVNPVSRTRYLESSHGKAISSEHFYVGKNCNKIESFLHREFAEHNDKITPVGDGCTEFFHDTVVEQARVFLEKFKEQNITKLNKMELERLLTVERKYCHWLISRLFGHKLSKESCTGQPYEFFAGFWDCQTVQTCLSVGFSVQEVAHKFSDNMRDKRFTTSYRISVAMDLYENGTTHMRNLKQLISECPESLAR